jgi:hypothetical protein
VALPANIGLGWKGKTIFGPFGIFKEKSFITLTTEQWDLAERLSFCRQNIKRSGTQQNDSHQTTFVVVMKQQALKNVNNCLNTNIYSYLQTSGCQSYNLCFMLFIF